VADTDVGFLLVGRLTWQGWAWPGVGWLHGRKIDMDVYNKTFRFYMYDDGPFRCVAPINTWPILSLIPRAFSLIRAFSRIRAFSLIRAFSRICSPPSKHLSKPHTHKKKKSASTCTNYAHGRVVDARTKAKCEYHSRPLSFCHLSSEHGTRARVC
jgi:hypothetical protein